MIPLSFLLLFAPQNPVEVPPAPMAPFDATPELRSASPALSIAENAGQFSPDILFALNTKDRLIQFKESGLQIALKGGENFEFEFGAEGKDLAWRGKDASGTSFNYCSGPAENWVLDAQGWFAISAEVQPGVELVVEFIDSKLKYSFHLDAGVQPSDLIVRFPSSDAAIIQEDGSLVIEKASSQITDLAPKAWQNHADSQQAVEVKFQNVSVNEGCAIQLVVGDFDSSLPLIVDPEMLLICGLIGGSLNEEGRGIGVDAAGNVFVAGLTQSDDMEVANAFQGTYGGGAMDVWVAKIAPDGSLPFLTYLGGSSKELPYDLSMDPAGNAYVVGGTLSTDFPYLNGPDAVHHGSLDCFVTKLDTNGTPVYSGTFGGSQFDSLRGNYVDAAGIHYVIGRSFTDDGTFPINGGPLTSHSGGVSDVIMAKISADGGTLMFSGFLGGDRIDYGRDIMTDSSGNVYACGWTNSDENTFPTVVGPSLIHSGGDKDYGMGWPQYGDAWVAKLTPDGTTFHYVGFIGGIEGDACFAVEVDEQDRLIVAGHTTSDETTFPVAVGPSLEFKGNANIDIYPYGDAWVGRVKADGTGLEYAGYVGGTGQDRAWRMTRGKIDGAIYLVGTTSSPANELPHADAGARSHRRTGEDGFVTRVESEGRWVDYTSLFPADGKVLLRDAVVGPDNKVSVTGWSETGIGFPVVTPGWDYTGGRDAFVATLPAFHELIRAGNLWPDPVTETRPAILQINGSAGADYLHEVTSPPGVYVTVTVDSPQGLNEPFAIYVIPHEATAEDAFHIEYSGVQFGTSTFAMPWFLREDPKMVTLVNGFGAAIMGDPAITGTFKAPSTFGFTPPQAGTYTLQGIIADSGKATGYSLTNAIILKVQP